MRLDIVVPHYKEPWEVCHYLFDSLALQRGICFENIKVILVNLSKEPFVINRGERIAQMVIARHEQIEWESVLELSESDRGEGGFG